MKLIIIGLLIFWAGFYTGSWDAKYGAEVGEKHGIAARRWLIEKGWIND